MKTIQIKLFGALVIAALALGGCNFIDYDQNIDPNNPSDVEASQLLPSAQVSMGYIIGGEMRRFASLWTQHHAGVERQHAGYEVYQVKENDINNSWNNFYSETMTDLDLIIQKTEGTSPHYSGVAKIMMANCLGVLVDMYNDVPYSQALQGAENFTPAFDDAATLYGVIQTLLAEGEAEVQSVASVQSPGSDDFIYGGDLAKWVELSNTLSARYYLRLTEVSGTAKADALNALAEGAISSSANDAEVPFGSAATEANPWYQFEDQRGDVVMGEFFINLMVSINDPRLPVFATLDAGGTGYLGAPAGVPTTTAGVAYSSIASRFGSALCSSASPLPLTSYVETKFIEAEANLGTDDAAAAAAHNAAIIASLAKFGVSDATYEAAEAAETAATINMTKILTHKYIALYTTLEPYHDFRRKGVPALAPAAGQTQVATRYPYPGDERLYNSANLPSGVTVNDRVFWDQ